MKTLLKMLICTTVLISLAMIGYIHIVNPRQKQQLTVSSHILTETELSLSSLLDKSKELKFYKSNSKDPCVRNFLRSFDRNCSKMIHPNPANIPDEWRKKLLSLAVIEKPILCPCIPRTLIGSLSRLTDLKRSPEAVHESLRRNNAAMAGGRWYPTECIARQRVAIVIPFRNRDEHLRRLVYALHPVLQRQQLDYTIFVIEQLRPKLFNRASLINVGYKESQSIGVFDCYIFHDVDMIPNDDRNFYTCSSKPRHMALFSRSSRYQKYFGGIIAIKSEQFHKLNGFSNEFYGWGGEDDDFRNRIESHKMGISSHFPKCVSTIFTPPHKLDSDNPMNENRILGLVYRPQHYRLNGINSVRYTVERVDKNLLYTKLSINLLPPPPPSE